MECSSPLEAFIGLVSNVMEAYTTALFIPEQVDEASPLRLICSHSFSKNIQSDCRIFPGEGFVGWVHREDKPVLVNRFERSSTTLKFYSQDEEIKALLAVPLPGREGVLYVDSKKSYRFTEQQEKICRQLAATALDLWQAQQRSSEQEITANLLSLSLEMDDLLFQNRQDNLFQQGLELLGRHLELSTIFFVVPGVIVHYSLAAAKENKYIHRTVPAGSFSQEGLLGWCIKNSKRIIRPQMSPGKGKSFVLHKEESLGPFENFVGLPLFLEGKKVGGGLGLVKKSARAWHDSEVESGARIGQRFFRGWMASEKKV